MQIDGSQIGISAPIARFSHRAVPVDRQGAHRKEVTIPREHPGGDPLDETGRLHRYRGQASPRRGGRRRYLDTMERTEGRVDGREVALHHGRSSAPVRLVDRAPDRGERLVPGHHAGQREEARLHHRVDASTHARGARHRVGVDDPQAQVLRDDLLLDLHRQVVPDLVRPVRAVEQEGGPRLRGLQDVDPLQEAEVVAGDDVRTIDQIGRPDRLVREPHVRDGKAA
jgi:hypothetical protein